MGTTLIIMGFLLVIGWIMAMIYGNGLTDYNPSVFIRVMFTLGVIIVTLSITWILTTIKYDMNTATEYVKHPHAFVIQYKTTVKDSTIVYSDTLVVRKH